MEDGVFFTHPTKLTVSSPYPDVFRQLQIPAVHVSDAQCLYICYKKESGIAGNSSVPISNSSNFPFAEHRPQKGGPNKAFPLIIPTMDPINVPIPHAFHLKIH